MQLLPPTIQLACRRPRRYENHRNKKRQWISEKSVACPCGSPVQHTSRYPHFSHTIHTFSRTNSRCILVLCRPMLTHSFRPSPSVRGMICQSSGSTSSALLARVWVVRHLHLSIKNTEKFFIQALCGPCLRDTCHWYLTGATTSRECGTNRCGSWVTAPRAASY